MKLTKLYLFLVLPFFCFGGQEQDTAVGDLDTAYRQEYVIGVWRTGGLGSCLHAVLNHLSYCEVTKKIPIVYWDRLSFYFDQKGFNGKQNVWEYYFEPVSPRTFNGNRRNVHSSYATGAGDYFSYKNVSYQMRYKASQLIKKYIKPNLIVQEKVDTFHETYMEGHTHIVGIHLRGTDKYKEEKPVSPKSIVDEALHYAREDTLFLIATDEQRLLDSMIKLLEKAGKKVIYYDCYRSEDGRPLHMHSSVSSTEKPSYAQLGEDVLVEMLLLARCDLLVHSLSNVSSCVLYFNPNMRHVIIQ